MTRSLSLAALTVLELAPRRGARDAGPFDGMAGGLARRVVVEGFDHPHAWKKAMTAMARDDRAAAPERD